MHVPGIKNLIDNFLVEDIATELGLIDLELKSLSCTYERVMVEDTMASR